jgi:PAS domain S-box-containing protein
MTMSGLSSTQMDVRSLPMSYNTPIVFVIDDDFLVCEYLEALIRDEGWQVRTFQSATAFLPHPRILVPSCLVLDISLPDISGLDLQKRLVAEGANIPIIFITGYGDIPKAVQAMKAGAVEFLTKPFGDDALLSAIRQALKRSRAALDHEVESEAKLRRLMDANVVGICLWDLNGQILEANDAFLNMLQYNREDVVSGRVRWTDLTPAEWRAGDERAVAELRSTGTFQPVEKEYFRKDGSRVPVLIGGTLFEEGGHEGVAFVLDLTERKRAEEEHERLRQLESELAHVNRLGMMGELAASLAHEILNPIATARNNARVGQRFLEMSPPNLNEVREALRCVVRDTDRAKHIVGRMRDHIKKAPPRRESFDLNEAIGEVIVMVRSTIARNRITVSTHLLDELLPVWGDRVQLQQVVLNLILNAVEAIGSVEVGPRELSISTGQDHTGVLVAVRDSGPGIAPSQLERVFKAFYTTKSSGVGMGLSICRSIIDAHGGRLWAQANEPRGAVFQFTLAVGQEES